MEMKIQVPVITTINKSCLFTAIAIVLCSRHILQLLGFSRIASMLFEVLYILTAAYAAIYILRGTVWKFRRFDCIYLICGWMALLIMLRNILIRYFSYWQEAMTFLLIFSILLSIDTIFIDEKATKIFFRGIILIGIVLAVLVFVPSGYENGDLVLYTGNGNQSGLFYMSIFGGVFVYQYLYKRHWFLFGLMMCLMYGCWQTHSRTSIMGCFLIICCSVVISRKNIFGRNIYVSVMVFFIVLPFMISILVRLLGENFQIFGISAWTGRDVIWPYAIEKLMENPFVFRINEVLYELNGGDLGAHNVWLTVAWNYSLPVAIIFIISLFRLGKSLFADNRTKEVSVLIAYFVGGVWHMSFESSILVGALDYSLYFLLTLLSGRSIIKLRKGSLDGEKRVC